MSSKPIITGIGAGTIVTIRGIGSVALSSLVGTTLTAGGIAVLAYFVIKGAYLWYTNRQISKTKERACECWKSWMERKWGYEPTDWQDEDFLTNARKKRVVCRWLLDCSPRAGIEMLMELTSDTVALTPGTTFTGPAPASGPEAVSQGYQMSVVSVSGKRVTARISWEDICAPMKRSESAPAPAASLYWLWRWLFG